MLVDKHGLKMKGLKIVAGESRNIPDRCYLQLNYNKATGEVWTDLLSGFDPSWVEYHDVDIIRVGNIRHQMSMQEIADMIAADIDYEKEQRRWFEEEMKYFEEMEVQ